MSRERSALRNRAEWLALRGALGTLELLPDRWLGPCMTGLARVAAAVSPARRRRSRALVQARLGLSEAAAASVVRASFKTLLLNVVDPIVLERHLRSGHPLTELVDVDGSEHLRAALASRRGVLVCTGHIGAWEGLGIVLAELFEPMWGITRELDNPLIERFVLERRGRRNLGVIPKDGGALKLARALRAGQGVLALLDQNAGRSGAILDFLGAPSSHHTVAGHVAVRQGALVVPVYLLRREDGRGYRFLVEPPIEPAPGLEREAAALDITRRLSQSLERQVRAAPGQWLWLHDRWRHAERVLKLEASASAGPAADGRTALAGAKGTNGG